MTIFFNVVRTVPNAGEDLRTSMHERPCFSDWGDTSYGYFEVRREQHCGGWFVVALDAFHPEPCSAHRSLLRTAERWLLKRGFVVRLITVSDIACEIPDRTPAFAVYFTPDDNRAKLFNALCFVRMFTLEFTMGRKVPKGASLPAFMRFLLNRPLNYPGHTPFREGLTKYDWATSRVKPEIDNRLGAAYLAYLDQLYRRNDWETRSRCTVQRSVEDDYYGYWTGALSHDDWMAFYNTYTAE